MMKFYGLGIDATSAKRIMDIAKHNSRFREVFFSLSDDSEIDSTKLSNFSIFEALFKALHCPTSFSPKDINVTRTKSGHPSISLGGRAGEIFKNYRFEVSVTHHEDLIISVVIAFFE